MSNEPYDSTADTMAHIQRVGELLRDVEERLYQRSLVHDDSKLKSPEKEAYDLLTPRLKSLTYGSDEYRASLREMKPAIQHHYAHNSHHPEHYENGINGMSLLDLVEMLCDWKAASERHADGDFAKSLEINRDRFNIGQQLEGILINTARELDLIASNEDQP